MKILLTGASGFIGSHLLRELTQHEITALARKPLADFNGRYCQYDLVEGVCDNEVFQGADVIIHCAARVHMMNDAATNPLDLYREVNTVGTLKLARQAAEYGVKRFIFVSSIKVNGESTEVGFPFTADDKPNPVDPYGQSKAEAEEQLLALSEETGLEVVIIRPTLVYGEGVKANFSALMNLVAKGFPLPFGAINDNRRSLVSVYNVVDLIIACLDHPKAANQVFLVSDDQDVSTTEMIRLMGKALGKPAKLIPIPVMCYSLAGKLFGKQDLVSRLTGSLQVDISSTKQLLSWTPPYKLSDSFKMTAQDLLESKK